MASVLSEAPRPVVKRSERSRDTLYADMMKPDEDLSKMSDPVERRRIQNRLAQRAYRRKMRDQKNEVEKLRSQIKRLQETPETCASGQNSPSTSPEGTPTGTGSLSPAHFELASSAGSEPQWMNPYFPEWPESVDSHGLMTGLASPEIEAAMAFGDPKVMSPAFSPDLYGSTHGLPGAVSSLTLSSPGTPGRAHHPRSLSTSELPHSLGQKPNAGWPDPQISMMELEAGAGGAEAGSSEAQGAFVPKFDVAAHPEQFQYPSPPVAEDAAGWTLPGAKAVSRARRALSDPDAGPVPDANAPIVHLAVAGGHIGTLRILLKQCQVSVNAKDNNGYTPLQRAIINGHPEIVELLLQHGAEISVDN
ncbi:hypothetical protein F4780DRAFT_182529 [Xylariomycetidae sp. FL0641]|nr:hypothetical protein F4780DRAFT_182529 [Xylariomycetidae sp. FL0641]